MRYIITGGCGFVGTNLTYDLLDEGHEVLVLDNLKVGSYENFEKNFYGRSSISFIKFDISDPAFYNLYSDEFEEVDAIFHLAGMSGVRESIQYPDVWFENNVVGTFNILEVARRKEIDNVVMASSSAAVGNVDPPIHENMKTNPISPYGASKGFMELYASAYFHSYDMNVSALRFSNVYGPHSTLKVSIVAKFIRQILNGETLQIYGSGKQTRDFIFVKDLIGALKAASSTKCGGETFQICTGVETSVNEITKMICDKIKKYGFDDINIEYTDPAIGDILTNYATNEKAKCDLKWFPKVDLNTGLNKTIEWFMDGVKK